MGKDIDAMRKRKQVSILLGCLILLLGVFQVPAYANGLGYKTVKVGYYRAKNFQEGDGDTTLRSGFGYEYLQKIASYTGWKYAYVSGTWQELFDKLKAGEIDLMAGIAYEEDRSQEILYSDYEMLKETFYIYKDSKDSSMQSGRFDTYAGKRIGVVAEEKMTRCLENWIEENRVAAETVTYPNLQACAEAFNAHKIDGFVSADNIVSGISGISPVEMIGKVPYYLCVAKGETDTLAELNAAMSLINGQDLEYLAHLKNKYSADTTISIFLSKQEKDWLDNHTQLRVGYLDNYLPYSDISEDGTVNGFLKDEIEDIFKSLPGDYRIEPVYTGYESQAEMIHALKENAVDVIFPVGGEMPYAEQQGYQQSSVVLHAAVDMVFLDSNIDEISSIAVNQNNLLQYYYTLSHYPDAHIVYCDSAESCLQAVKQGKADSTMIEALRAVKLLEDKNMKMLPAADTCGICFGVAYGNQDLLCVLNHGLSILGEEYGLSRAYHYVGDIVQNNITDSIRAHIWLVHLFVLLLIIWGTYVVWTRFRRMKRGSKQHDQAHD